MQNIGLLLNHIWLSQCCYINTSEVCLQMWKWSQKLIFSQLLSAPNVYFWLRYFPILNISKTTIWTKLLNFEKTFLWKYLQTRYLATDEVFGVEHLGHPGSLFTKRWLCVYSNADNTNVRLLAQTRIHPLKAYSPYAGAFEPRWFIAYVPKIPQGNSAKLAATGCHIYLPLRVWRQVTLKATFLSSLWFWWMKNSTLTSRGLGADMNWFSWRDSAWKEMTLTSDWPFPARQLKSNTENFDQSENVFIKCISLQQTSNK